MSTGTGPNAAAVSAPNTDNKLWAQNEELHKLVQELQSRLPPAPAVVSLPYTQLLLLAGNGAQVAPEQKTYQTNI